MRHLRARLARSWQRLRTEPGLGRNTAVVLGLMLLGAIAGGIILSHQGSGLTNWPWTSRLTFHAKFDEAQGVAAGQGQEVRISGVTVGAIQSASISPDGKADLELGIDPRYKVYRNAVLVLRPKSPLNEMYVEVNPGAPPAPELVEGASLPMTNTRNPVTIDRVTQHLDDNTRAALGSLLTEADTALAHAPSELPSGLAGTDKVVRDLQPVLTRLAERKQTLASLVHQLSVVSHSVGGDDRRLGELADTLQRTLHTVGDRADPVNQSLRQLPETTSQIKQATDAVGQLTTQLDPTLDNLRGATGSLPGALSRLAGTADRVGTVASKATPVVDRATPVVNDLRPVVSDVNTALPDLKEITGRLEPVTRALVPRLPDLQAFVYNTSSATSVKTPAGGMLRGIGQVGPDSIPLLRTLGQPAK